MATRLLLCLVLGLGALPALADDLGSLSLEELLEVPVVTASRIPEKLAEAPATVLVFDRETIRERGWRDLSELLDEVPGMDVVRPRGATWFKAYWRGFRNTIGAPWLLLRDGLVLNHLYFNTADVLAALPLTDVRRVEVVVGPASSLYGANAFMGVVHVLTDTEAASSATRARIEVGEHDAATADVHLRGTAAGWTWSLAARTDNGDLDPDVPDEVVSADPALVSDPRLWGDVADGGRWGGTPSSPHRHRGLDLRARRGELELGAWFFKTSSGYGYEYAWDSAQPRAVWARSDLSAHLRWCRDLGEKVRSTTLLRYRTSGVDDDSTFAEAFEDDGGRRVVDLSVWEADNESWTLAQDLELHWWPDVMVWAGLEVEHRNLQKAYETAFGPSLPPEELDLTTYPIPRPGGQTGPPENRERTWDVGTYVQSRWTLREGRWVHVGVRWDDHSEYGDELTLRLGHVGREGPWTWRALYGESFQEPNPRLLYGGWKGSGSDPALSPERSRIVEAGLTRTHGRSEAALALWWAENRDTIINTGEQIIETPDGPIVVDPGARNLGDRTVRGLDWSFRYRPSDRLDLNFGWSHLLDAEEEVFGSDGHRSGTAPIGDLAEDRVWLGATWRREAWTVDGRGRWVGERRTVSTNPVGRIDAFTLVDLTVRRRLAGDRLVLGLRVTNLFDEEALHPGVRDASAGLDPGFFDASGRWVGSDGFFSSVLPQPGRAISAVLEIDLGG